MNTDLTPLDHFYHKVKSHFAMNSDAEKDLTIIYNEIKKMEVWNAEIRAKAEQIAALVVSNTLQGLTQDKSPNR